jgi:hypothetical protein
MSASTSKAASCRPVPARASSCRAASRTFRVQSATAQILGVMTPGGFEGLFRDLGTPATHRGLAEPGTVPFDVERVMAEQRRRGTEVVGPPMAAEVS